MIENDPQHLILIANLFVEQNDREYQTRPYERSLLRRVLRIIPLFILCLEIQLLRLRIATKKNRCPATGRIRLSYWYQQSTTPLIAARMP